ncbi:hypothetical protein M4L90_02800 [Staphylococcus equorum]|uniref:Uncharacterized protein n=1 Tax=Staphylococcus equorum TaxID=246432 RepID=A0A9X4L111_9STAP|nr:MULTISPECIES: hypothetical protein [Staphylococcus]MDG0818818.1 hypothetical protein [Staphylococcus equorum]MDG0839459.1 hypothetical protein [Staphylococcus equorum]MDG0844815.1 hypothetical protein [Staphylococcus equorum]CCI60643.1 putative uncharacterized protein [Staphylococcus equorum subsp. equorum Mu2]
MTESKELYKVFVKETKNSGYALVFESFEEAVASIKNVEEFDEIIISPSKREAQD